MSNDVFFTLQRDPRPYTIEAAAKKVYPGWEPLLTDMYTKLFDAGWNGKVRQVKEKFGTLRVYLDSQSDNFRVVETLNKIVLEAEGVSSRTCRECGAPGELRYGGWIKVLCDKHNKESH